VQADFLGKLFLIMTASSSLNLNDQIHGQ